MAKPERSSPTLLPEKRKIDRKVFLLPEHWERLSEIAEFHEATFRKMKRSQSVSRNDIIENFLKWAEEEYWVEKDGKPKNAEEREEKIAAFAERLEAKTEQLEAADAKTAKAADATPSSKTLSR